MKLLLVRHGQTQWNVELRTQGRTDTVLTDDGMEQARALSTRFSAWPVTAIYSSPLSRAIHTAEEIARPHDLQVIAAPALIERDFGAWEGISFQDLNTRYPKEINLWTEDPFAYTPPHGEPMQAMQLRLDGFLYELRERYGKEDTVLLVSHSVPLRMIIADLIGLPCKYIHNISLENAAYTEFRLSAKHNMLLALNAR